METIGLVVHEHRPEAKVIAAELAAFISGSGSKTVAMEADHSVIGSEHVDQVADLAVADACISIGGDGTILRAVRQVAKHGVGVLGINVGRLGYLAEVEPGLAEAATRELLAGGVKVSERMMVEAKPQSAGVELGLNEMVVRSNSGHSVSVAVKINGQDFMTYTADGLIVATPTGSTAYSLAAGGPVVESGFKALLLTPVAAHMAFNRSIVLPPNSRVEFQIVGQHPATVVMDGDTVANLAVGDTVSCGASETRARFYEIQPRSFHSVLREKFSI